ncbi:hypothetical protein N6H14_21155 [Paenibacillus sp. CC-CFT747]|nr:hypothetical protein N6H14_21155 [Paenibacillus sp. CC-CFT747]
MISQTSYSLVGQPCRNFTIFNYCSMVDPWDGREKLVLSNFTPGGIGLLVFIDTLTGAGESFELPGDSGAWGLVNWRNEKLIVGTCPQYAYLHSFDLRTRTWAEPLKAEGETYFWDIVEGSDGMIYGGTYPNCSLMRYDPHNHVLENLGRVSDNSKNLYSRYLHGELPGYILITYGYDSEDVKAFHIESGTFREFGMPGYRIREAHEELLALEKEGSWSSTIRSPSNAWWTRTGLSSGSFPGNYASERKAHRHQEAVRRTDRRGARPGLFYSGSSGPRS